MEIPWIAGVIFFIGLVLFIYFIKEYNTPIKETKKGVKTHPNKEDIVLTEITEENGLINYGIMWNGIPGKTYFYKIKAGNEIVAEGTSVTSKTNVFKIKGIPILSGSVYNVTVGISGSENATTVEIPFTPISFIPSSLIFDSSHIECDTNAPPTNLEVLLNGSPISVSNIGIRMDPPGFVIDLPSASENKEVTIMIYNGKNTTNIMVLNPGKKLETLVTDGQTPLPF